MVQLITRPRAVAVAEGEPGQAAAAPLPARLPPRVLVPSGAAIGGVAAFVRLWQLNALGVTRDEAVYAGQAAAIAGDPALKGIFPVFRAHPLLYQFVLAVLFREPGHMPDTWTVARPVLLACLAVAVLCRGLKAD